MITYLSQNMNIMVVAIKIVQKVLIKKMEKIIVNVWLILHVNHVLH